jgi:biopolymer transport protein TolR
VAKGKRERLRTLLGLLREGQENGKHQIRADINVTPLCDVVLVLLIIFMVVTPLIASGVAVDLPRTANHAKKADDGKDLIISVTWDKHTYLGSKHIPQLDELARQVAASKRQSPEKTIFIKGDTRAPFGLVRDVIETLHKADVEDVILGTEELSVRPE